MKPYTTYAIMVLSVVIGGGSLLLFGIFLIIGPLNILQWEMEERDALLWDGLLSLLFFIQHSGMMRSSFRTRLAPIVPRRCHPSLYAIASGIALTVVVFYWIPTSTVIYRLEGLYHFLVRSLCLAAIAGFWWGVRSLDHFDSFGLAPLKTHLDGRPLRSPEFVVRGPYRWVRHPLYFFVLVLIWSVPDVHSDRLLFNFLWTLWVVLGAVLEEKDLVAEFGEKYRRYQKQVPMLFPRRFPNRKTIKSH